MCESFNMDSLKRALSGMFSLSSGGSKGAVWQKNKHQCSRPGILGMKLQEISKQPDLNVTTQFSFLGQS